MVINHLLNGMILQVMGAIYVLLSGKFEASDIPTDKNQDDV